MIAMVTLLLGDNQTNQQEKSYILNDQLFTPDHPIKKFYIPILGGVTHELEPYQYLKLEEKQSQNSAINSAIKRIKKRKY